MIHFKHLQQNLEHSKYNNKSFFNEWMNFSPNTVKLKLWNYLLCHYGNTFYIKHSFSLNFVAKIRR